MTALEGLGDAMSRRVRAMAWWRTVRRTFLYAWFGAVLPFAGLVAFFLVAQVTR